MMQEPNRYALDAQARRQQRAGAKLLQQTVGQHMKLVARTSQRHAVDYVDLLSPNASEVATLPQRVRRQITRFQQSVRAIIEDTARKIEDQAYKQSETALNGMALSYNEATRAAQLLGAEKSVHVSCRALKLTSLYFADINQDILRSLEQAQSLGDTARARSLVLGNAIIVYELTDFVIRYIENFVVVGLEDIKRLRETVITETAELKEGLKELKKKARAAGVDPQMREQTLQGIAVKEESLKLLESEWKAYLKQMGEVEKEIDKLKRQLKTLQLKRDEAEIQIRFMQLIGMMQVIRDNFATIQATFETVIQIKLDPLLPERVSFLLGIQHEG